MVVRNESVRLSLDDDFTTKMARAAAATAVLRKELDGLDGTAVHTTRSVGPLGNEIDQVGVKSRRADSDINKLTGRLALFRDAALIAGPAIAPLGAAAVGGLVALSAQLGATAGALGVTVLAVSGLGDGLKALDAYQLEPTAANLEKLQAELKKLGPAGEDFVRFLDSIEPNLKSLQNAAREGLLPGAEEGIDAMLQRLPELRKLIRGMATEVGDLFADAGKDLAGEDFDAFFKFLRTDGIKILDDTGRTIGALAETVANLFVAFAGVETDFSGGLLEFSQGLAEASANLDTNQGFIKFVDFIETQGPHALETLGSLGNALLQIVEATAPLGGPVLTILGKFADIIAAIADSDLGTPIFAGLAALALLNRSMAITASLQSSTFGGPAVASLKAYVVGLGQVTSAQQRAQMSATQLAEAEAVAAAAGKGRLATLGKGAAVTAGLALATSGLADSTGLSNTAMYAALGSIVPGYGTAIGATAGYVMDFRAANGKATESIDAFKLALQSSQGDLLAQQELIDGLREKAAAMADDVDSDSFGEFLKNTFDPDVAVAFTRDAFGMTSAEDQLTAAADDAQRALDNQKNGVATLVTPLAGLAAGTREAAEAEKEQTEAIQGAIDAMRAKRQEALRGLDAELNYQAAIDDARKAVKENGKQFDITTEKGRANRQALYALADGWNQQSDAAKNAKGSLATARQGFIQTAIDMGATAAQAKRLADRLFEIPPKRKTKIEVESGDAEAKLDALNRFQFAPKVIAVRVAAHSAASGGGLPAEPSADGSMVPKTGLPYADRHLYVLADGEQIISNRYGQADRFRADSAAGRIPGYADGGTAGLAANTYTSRRRADGDDLWHVVGDDLWHVVDGLKGLNRQLAQAQKALERSEKALDKERDKRDQIADAMASTASTVSSGLRTDIFAAPSNPWASSAGGVAGANAALQGDINQGQMFSGLVAALQGRGLHGTALQSLLEQAAQNNDLGLLQQFAGASASDLANYQSLFDLRDQVLAGAGQATGQAVFGEAYSAQTKILEQQRDETKGLRRDVRSVEAAIERANNDNKSGQQQATAAFHTVGTRPAANARRRARNT